LKNAFPDLKVVWVDAHADCNTSETSPSQNFHGMPLSPVLGFMKKGTIPGFDWCYPNLKCSDVAYIGLRHLDDGEKRLIAKHNIKAYDMDAVTGLGIGQVMKEIFEYFGEDGKEHPIHCSFDVDGIDP
jgi:arginase